MLFSRQQGVCQYIILNGDCSENSGFGCELSRNPVASRVVATALWLASSCCSFLQGSKWCQLFTYGTLLLFPPCQVKYCLSHQAGVAFLGQANPAQPILTQLCKPPAVGSWSSLEAHKTIGFVCMVVKSPSAFLAKHRDSGVYVLFHLCDTAGWENGNCMLQLYCCLHCAG